MKKNKTIVLILILAAVVAVFAGIYISSQKQNTVLNTDNKAIKLVIQPYDTSSNAIDITTSKTTLGDALVENDLITYEDSEFGRFILGINGYDHIDGKYWMIYVNEKMSEVGMDKIELSDENVYKLAQE